MSLGGSDAWIAKHLGMDKDEVLRLKQITLAWPRCFDDVKIWTGMASGRGG